MRQRDMKVVAMQPTEEYENREREVRLRAYELYEARGREDGHDLEDWFRAEGEIAKKMLKIAA